MAHGIVSTGYSYPDGTIDTGGGLFGSGVEAIVSSMTYSVNAVLTKERELIMWNGDSEGSQPTAWNGTERRSPWMVTFPKRTGYIVDAEVVGAVGRVLWSDGDLFAWGGNAYGAVGNNTTSKVHEPVLVASNVSKLFKTSYQGYHTTAMPRYIQKTDGKIYGTGYGGTGMFGDGTTSNRLTYTAINGPSNRFDASVSNNTVRDLWQLGGHWGVVMLQLNDNTIWGCGHNPSGQIGYTAGQQNTWLDVTTAWGGATQVSKVVGGAGGHDGTNPYASGTCGMLKADGTVRICGYNGYGQFGNGNTTSSATPYVTSLSGVKDLCARGGMAVSFYALDNTTLYSWGYNGYGQLGVGDTTNRSTIQSYTSGITSTAYFPMIGGQGSDTNQWYATMFVRKSTSPWASIISAGYNYHGVNGWGINGSGTAVTTGAHGPYNTHLWGEGAGILPDIVQMSISGRNAGQYILALDSKGKLWTWGYNAYYDVTMGHYAGIQTYMSTPIRYVGV